MLRALPSGKAVFKTFTSADDAKREADLMRVMSTVFPTVLDVRHLEGRSVVVTDRCKPLSGAQPSAQMAGELIPIIGAVINRLHTEFNVAHLSLNPEHIAQTREGEFVLLDPGAAQFLGAPLQFNPKMLGGFTAADVLVGGAFVEARLDWFSLGAVALWVATRTVPFSSHTDYRYIMLKTLVEKDAPFKLIAALFPPVQLDIRILQLLTLGVARRHWPRRPPHT